MTELWGVIWTRGDEVAEPTWYDSKEEAISEWNQRGDKYWHCPLVTTEIGPVTVKKQLTASPFEAGYDNFYYHEDA